MQTVDVWNEDQRCQQEEEDMTRKEVQAPELELNDLHDELARGLRHHVHAKTVAVPLAHSPRAVSLVVLELAGEEDG